MGSSPRSQSLDKGSKRRCPTEPNAVERPGAMRSTPVPFMAPTLTQRINRSSKCLKQLEAKQQRIEARYSLPPIFHVF
jgi:hypothetical protein